MDIVVAIIVCPVLVNVSGRDFVLFREFPVAADREARFVEHEVVAQVVAPFKRDVRRERTIADIVVGLDARAEIMGGFGLLIVLHHFAGHKPFAVPDIHFASISPLREVAKAGAQAGGGQTACHLIALTQTQRESANGELSRQVGIEAVFGAPEAVVNVVAVESATVVAIVFLALLRIAVVDVGIAGRGFEELGGLIGKAQRSGPAREAFQLLLGAEIDACVNTELLREFFFGGYFGPETEVVASHAREREGSQGCKGHEAGCLEDAHRMVGGLVIICWYLENAVDRFDGFFGVVVINAQHGHIGQEVDSAHFHAHDFQSEALLKVGLEFFITLGNDEVYIVVAHEFASNATHEQIVLCAPNGCQQQEVGRKAFHQAEVGLRAVEHRKGNEEEEVGHLTDGHALCSITDDAENGKQAQSRSDLQVGTVHQVNQHEDADGEQNEGEIIIAAASLGIIEEMDNGPHDGEVEQKADTHFEQSVEVAEILT